LELHKKVWTEKKRMNLRGSRECTNKARSKRTAVSRIK